MVKIRSRDLRLLVILIVILLGTVIISTAKTTNMSNQDAFLDIENRTCVVISH